MACEATRGWPCRQNALRCPSALTAKPRPTQHPPRPAASSPRPQVKGGWPHAQLPLPRVRVSRDPSHAATRAVGARVPRVGDIHGLSHSPHTQVLVIKLEPSGATDSWDWTDSFNLQKQLMNSLSLFVRRTRLKTCSRQTEDEHSPLRPQDSNKETLPQGLCSRGLGASASIRSANPVTPMGAGATRKDHAEPVGHTASRAESPPGAWPCTPGPGVPPARTSPAMGKCEQRSRGAVPSASRLSRQSPVAPEGHPAGREAEEGRG